MNFDPRAIQAELEWLQDNLAFQEKPASIVEFLGPGYLNIEKGVRPGIRTELITMFGTAVNAERIALYRWAMFTGAIGIGKTTLASITLPYMCHWVLCLKDPQDFYDLLPGSRIAFMQMSTSEEQAKEVVFGDIKARIQHCQWFQENYPYDPSFKNQIRFEKDVWLIPGNSAETAFEGYNILGGILDEADSHKITKDKDYAEQGFDTINSRIDSRFEDKGFLIVIGQMKSATGFAKKKYDEMRRDKENAHTVRMTIWESRGWERYTFPNGERDSFWYDTKRKNIVPTLSAKLIQATSDNLIEIPNVFRKNFENNPEKALRDLAGIPPASGDTFISLSYKLEEAVERWVERHGPTSPVNEDPVRPQFAEWFKAQESLRRAMHLDIAYSPDGDALGLAMGHVNHMIEIEGEQKPYIVFDFLLRMVAPPGHEILLQGVRQMIYMLKDERLFKIRKATMDGFQSTDTKQQLRKHRINTEMLSVDKSKLPYEDLRDAIYEDRIEFPPYWTYLKKGGSEKLQIAIKELTELEDTDKMVDHPVGGSKDVADCMAGVVYTLMGDRSYRRRISSQELLAEQRDNTDTQDPFSLAWDHKQLNVSPLAGGMHAPLPPTTQGTDLHMPIPPRLAPRRDR